MAGILGQKRDFFISRAGEDRDVGLVIDEILRDAGYSTFIQDKDFGHTAFPERMDEGFRMVEAGARIVALLSRAYQEKPHCRVEAQYPLADDPTNSRQRLIVLRIEDCAPVGFLKTIPYVDLVPLLADAAAVRMAPPPPGIRGEAGQPIERRAGLMPGSGSARVGAGPRL
jgi:hypothetical protein